MKSSHLDFLDELGLQLHRSDAADLAIDIVVAIDQSDVFDFGADLYDQRCALDLEILDDSDRVTVGKEVAVRVLHY